MFLRRTKIENIKDIKMYLYDMIVKYNGIRERETLLGYELGKYELALDIFKKIQEILVDNFKN